MKNDKTIESVLRSLPEMSTDQNISITAPKVCLASTPKKGEKHSQHNSNSFLNSNKSKNSNKKNHFKILIVRYL